jgi:hypothetical protein
VTKQNTKTFLLEMPVVGEHAADAFSAHGRHYDAIIEAVALWSSVRLAAGSLCRWDSLFGKLVEMGCGI